ncbi:MAG: hypothetical protein RIR51_677, partial [Bacteroidota bacterium]
IQFHNYKFPDRKIEFMFSILLQKRKEERDEKI